MKKTTKILKLIKILVPLFREQYTKYSLNLLECYIYDYKRTKSLAFIGRTNKISEKYVKIFINIWSHSIEKGLSTDELKLGFGQEKIINLCNLVVKYSESGAKNDDSILQSAISSIINYYNVHEHKMHLLNEETINNINRIRTKFSNIVMLPSVVISEKNTDEERNSIANIITRRRSVRQFRSDKVVDQKLIEKVINLAIYCPSACNRQPYKVRYTSDKNKIERIMSLQGGGGGFSCIPTLLIITFFRSYYHNAIERNSGYIDSGIFVMNLVYSLMAHEVDSCILNNAFDYKKDIMMRELLTEITPDEEFVVFVAVGFRIPNSKSPASIKNSLQLEII
jgi:nitroreductase